MIPTKQEMLNEQAALEKICAAGKNGLPIAAVRDDEWEAVRRLHRRDACSITKRRGVWVAVEVRRPWSE